MDKKVTRRVALGTVAVGLGGLAAAPYIIRSLKGRYYAKTPGDGYEKGWESVVKMLDVPIKEISGPSSVTLDYKPQVGTKSRVTSFSASYYGVTDPSVYPKPPKFYSFLEGSIAGLPPIVDNLPALLIKAEKIYSSALTFHTDKLGGESIFVPKNGEYAFYESTGSIPKLLPRGKVNGFCASMATDIIFPYPKGKSLGMGVKWAIPENYDFCIELPCEIVGFAEVAGRETVKMVSKRELNNQEVLKQTTVQNQQVAEIEKERGNNYNADEVLKHDIKAAVEGKKTRAFNITTYVDLKTGFVNRQELIMITHSVKNEANYTGISIIQVLEV